MTLSDFRSNYPEMSAISDLLVGTFLARAASSLDIGVYGGLYDEAHGCLAAHLLVLSPYGKNARLQSEKGKTTYGNRFDEIRILSGSGLCRVI